MRKITDARKRCFIHFQRHILDLERAATFPRIHRHIELADIGARGKGDLLCCPVVTSAETQVMRHNLSATTVNFHRGDERCISPIKIAADAPRRKDIRCIRFRLHHIDAGGSHSTLARAITSALCVRFLPYRPRFLTSALCAADSGKACLCQVSVIRSFGTFCSIRNRTPRAACGYVNPVTCSKTP